LLARQVFLHGIYTVLHDQLYKENKITFST